MYPYNIKKCSEIFWNLEGEIFYIIMRKMTVKQKIKENIYGKDVYNSY